MLSARQDSTHISEGILVKEDPVKSERNLAAAIIFQAWKEASEGDPSALSFGLGEDSNLPLWCHLCGMDVDLTRTCFQRLQEGEYPTPPLIIPAAFINRDRRKYAQYAFTHDEARCAAKLFIEQRRDKNLTREETYTWIALEMGKRFEVVEKLMMVIHKALREHRPPVMELPDDFQEAWTNRGRGKDGR